MAHLTAFQIDTERALNEQLKVVGEVIEDRKVSGDMEPFVEGKIGDLAIWIYADEVCVIGRGVERVFEKWDFNSEEELRSAFIGLLLQLVQTRN